MSDEAHVSPGRAVELLMDDERSAPGTPLAALLTEEAMRSPHASVLFFSRRYLTHDVGAPPELLLDLSSRRCTASSTC
jgi:hypothetical protein